ncbi:MAG TPA: DUF222 domain-containing protein [Micromonosporaceae bacterium]
MWETLAQIAEAASACADVSVWALGDTELVAALDAVHMAEQRLAAVQLTLVREIDGRGLAKADGASSTAVWLRDRLRIGGPATRRLVDLAGSLDSAPAVVRDALVRGTISVEQGRVIAQAVAAVPAEAGAEVTEKAAQLLVDWADRFEPEILRRLGERVLSHVAPDLADHVELRALQATAARALSRRHVTLSDQPDGQVRLSGSLDVETAAVVRAAIDPLCAPAGPDDDRTPGQRRADALGEVCRLALHTGQLPANGGDGPQVVVTVEHEALAGRLGTGALDTGVRLTPAAVRRLACDAGILPAVLGGAGQVLDVGRQRRLITGPLRRALVLRDRGCVFPGCDRPPRWCDAHHVVHWTDGGPTALHNAVLLCGHHHRLIHAGDWAVHLAADGMPEFVPPAWLDPLQRPRRNLYHRRS